MGLELMQLLCRRHLSFKYLPDISAPDLPLQVHGAASEAELRLENQKLRQKLALEDTRSSRNDKDIKELISLVTRLIQQLAASESQLEACKLENASLSKACSRQLICIWKLRNLLQQHEGSQVVPEAEPTTSAAADNTFEPATPARQLFPMFVGAAEPSSEFDDSSSSSSCASPTETEVQGSVAASPLQRSHSVTPMSAHSLPQLPDTLGLGDLPLARCLSSPLDTAGSGAEDGGDSSIANTPSKQQGSECNTSELAMPARRWFPVLLEPTSVDRSSSGSSTCASPSPAGAQGTATSSPLQRSHSVTHSFTHSLPQLPGTLGLDDLPFTRRLSSPLLGSVGSGAECGGDSSITNTPSKQQGSGCSAESPPQSSKSCSMSSPASAATDMSASGLGAHIGQVSIANHRLSPMSCTDDLYMVKHAPALWTHNLECVAAKHAYTQQPALSVCVQIITAEDSSQLTQPGDGSSEYEECMALLLGTDA
jgi:hypothetical protein